MDASLSDRIVDRAVDSIIDARDVQTRDDLAEYLSASLPGEYKMLVGEGEIRNTSTHVKSYLVEAHADVRGGLPERLSPTFGIVTRLQDRSLYLASRHNLVFFVDAGDPRFLVLHSTAPMKETDAIFRKLTEQDLGGIDHAWLPGPFLNGQTRGELTGFKFRYQTGVSGVTIRRTDPETGQISYPLRPMKFAMTVADDLYAEQEFSNLVEANAFEGRKALEQVQFRAGDPENSDDVIVSSVYSNGKLVGKGTSVGGYLYTVASVLEAYRYAIYRIENQFALGWVPAGGGLVHHGEPFVFKFPLDTIVVDVQSFARSLFSASRPFRLFGIPHRASDDRVDVEAIDLHTGDPLSFEIGRAGMRVFLPRGSCGNIIARLYTNLLHSMSAAVTLSVGGTDPFSEQPHGV